MTISREKLQSKLDAIEEQIEALEKRIRESDGLAKARHEKELNDLILAQKDVEQRLEAVARSQ